jgi:hypothetical protein
MDILGRYCRFEIKKVGFVTQIVGRAGERSGFVKQRQRVCEEKFGS